MRSLRIRLLAAAFLLLGGACDSMLTRPSLYNSIQVIVTTRDGEGVPGADLVLYTGQRPMGYGKTDSAGRFTFTRVPAGQYGVVATPPPGYDLIERLVQSRPSNVVDQLVVSDDTLPPVRFTFLKVGFGSLTVRINQADGAPMPGLVVTLYDPNATRGNQTSDATGQASFMNLPFGVYGVTFQRPFLFRDFRVPGDSLYATRDNLIVDSRSNESVAFVLQKCVGTSRVLAQDETGAPVRGATAVFYTATQVLAQRQTGADGRTSYSDMPCAIQAGLLLAPPSGYSLVQGRGSSFFDGISMMNGQSLDFTFRLRKIP